MAIRKSKNFLTHAIHKEIHPLERFVVLSKDMLGVQMKTYYLRLGVEPSKGEVGARSSLRSFLSLSQVFFGGGASNRLSPVSDDAIFSARDRNGDGQLEYAEHGIPPGLDGAPNGVMRVLDLDASGAISRSEFVKEGRMVYFVQEETPDGSIDNTKGMTFVEFKFTKERATLGRYEGAKINAQGLDRLVVWPLEGLPMVMEGRVSIASGIENLELQADTVTMPE